MRISILVVGRPRHVALGAAIADYESRAARYWPVEFVEVREESSRAILPAQVREREGERIAARVLSGTRLVVCDPGGENMNSEVFSVFVHGFRERGENVAFAIGGAHGLGENIRARADRKLSLAPWTLPHELARLVLAEQLYRAGTIQRGEPYHK